MGAWKRVFGEKNKQKKCGAQRMGVSEGKCHTESQVFSVCEAKIVGKEINLKSGFRGWRVMRIRPHDELDGIHAGEVSGSLYALNFSPPKISDGHRPVSIHETREQNFNCKITRECLVNKSTREGNDVGYNTC